MPLPVAHGLIGASVVAAIYPSISLRVCWRNLFTAAVLAITPDLDFIPVFFLHFNPDFHRTFTHSITFALLIGLLKWTFSHEDRLKGASIYTWSILSHTILDYLTTKNGGVELLWPFSTERYKYGWFDYPDPWRSELLLSRLDVIIEIFKISFFELLIFTPILFLALSVNVPIKKRWTSKE